MREVLFHLVSNQLNKNKTKFHETLKWNYVLEGLLHLWFQILLDDMALLET
jgi:hypothetical protein